MRGCDGAAPASGTRCEVLSRVAAWWPSSVSLVSRLVNSLAWFCYTRKLTKRDTDMFWPIKVLLLLWSLDLWSSRGQVRWVRTRPDSLRRWFILICVDWLPLDFTTSRSWPFSRIRDHRPKRIQWRITFESMPVKTSCLAWQRGCPLHRGKSRSIRDCHCSGVRCFLMREICCWKMWGYCREKFTGVAGRIGMNG